MCLNLKILTKFSQNTKSTMPYLLFYRSFCFFWNLRKRSQHFKLDLAVFTYFKSYFKVGNKFIAFFKNKEWCTIYDKNAKCNSTFYNVQYYRIILKTLKMLSCKIYFYDWHHSCYLYFIYSLWNYKKICNLFSGALLNIQNLKMVQKSRWWRLVVQMGLTLA